MAEQQRERDIAEMEAQMIHAENGYFEARPQIMRTRDKETTFEAGFKAAWEARALSHAEGEAVNWDDAQAVCDLPEVHDCLQCFSEDSTGDNGTEVVRAVMQATHPAPQVAVPEGYALVPVDPNEEMLDAWFTAPRGDSGSVQDFATAYRAMLAAAGEIKQVTAYDHGIPTTVTSSDDPALNAHTGKPAGEPDDSDICEQVELPHVLAWADGIRGDMCTEYADRITDEEARVAQAVWAAHTGEQPVSDPDGAVEVLRAFERAKDLWLPSDVDEEHIGEAQALHKLRRRALAVIDKAIPAPDEREIAALRKDAERYRWLREKDNFPGDDGDGESLWDQLCDVECDEFDEFIDRLREIGGSHD